MHVIAIGKTVPNKCHLPFDAINIAQHLYRRQITIYQPINIVTRPNFNALSISVSGIPIDSACSDVSTVIST